MTLQPVKHDSKDHVLNKLLVTLKLRDLLNIFLQRFAVRTCLIYYNLSKVPHFINAKETSN